MIRRAGLARRQSHLSAFFLLGAFLTCLACNTRVETVDSGSSADIEALTSDPAALSEYIVRTLQNTDPLERARAISELLLGLSPDSLQPVLDGYEDAFLDQGDVELVLLAEWWASFDPVAALAWTSKNLRTDHPRVEAAVVRAWARRDPLAAAGGAIEGRSFASKPIFETEMKLALAVGWFETGKPGLLDYLRRIRSLETQQRALNALARLHVLRDGPEAAMHWADELSDGEPMFKLRVIQRVAGAAARVDPPLTARWAARNLHEWKKLYVNQSYPILVYTRVALMWVRVDPEAAMAWLRGLDPGIDRDVAVSDAFNEWRRRDLAAANAWLRRQKPGQAWLDLAVASFVRQQVDAKGDIDWAEALRWATPIEKEEQKWAAVAYVARSWLIDDPTAAEAWLATRTEIPELYQRKIREITDSARKKRERRRSASPIGPAG